MRLVKVVLSLILALLVSDPVQAGMITAPGDINGQSGVDWAVKQIVTASPGIDFNGTAPSFTLTDTTAVLAAQPQRTLLILENISDTNIDCVIGTAAVAGAGFRLYANGGALVLDKKYPLAAINCIHAATGSKTLLVTEGRLP